ncbi:hypothetical protein MIND_01331800 [Mycena indigotica]|uniref:Uncharacterized protein n=1 Tax=Mycena indigotica TaxID=2126181 RepID=A0A8H6VVW8_9AGAR|nr:uncharacterized protein MIND_01331800 [Mycena indigotica]KAF7290184.1 hypothetical protein MIND_01331800 [Mycena indigotica]
MYKRLKQAGHSASRSYTHSASADSASRATRHSPIWRSDAARRVIAPRLDVARTVVVRAARREEEDALDVFRATEAIPRDAFRVAALVGGEAVAGQDAGVRAEQLARAACPKVPVDNCGSVGGGGEEERGESGGEREMHVS